MRNPAGDAYQDAERGGMGAVGLDGAMVDRPIYQRALDLLRWQSAVDGAERMECR